MQEREKKIALSKASSSTFWGTLNKYFENQSMYPVILTQLTLDIDQKGKSVYIVRPQL